MENSVSVTLVESNVHSSWLFKASMWWRIGYGFLRLILGIALLRLIGNTFSSLIYVLMAHELTGKFGDAVLEKLYTVLEIHDYTVTYFIAIYFIFWGIIEIVLSRCLLNHVREAFPITMVLIVIFIIYGLYRFTHTHSLILLGVIFIDIFILYLINREYNNLKLSLVRVIT